MLKVITRLNNEDSIESKSALDLKKLIDTSAPSNIDGEIYIVSNAYINGRKVKDIDIVVFGVFNPFKFEYSSNGINHSIVLSSFISTIELKNHDISSIQYSGTNFLVKYNNHWHSATNQSHEQSVSLRSILNLDPTPFVTNFIWFKNVDKIDLHNLIKDSMHKNINVFPSNFDFYDFIKRIILSKERYTKVCDLNISNNKMLIMDSLNATFINSNKTLGFLTRKKIEQLTNKELLEKIDYSSLNIKGQAGTGKTHKLLHYAFHLSEHQSKRVVMLTYNKLLAFDIERIFSFTPYYDSYNEYGFRVDTIHSFVRNYLIHLGIIDKYCSDFLEKYHIYLKELVDFIKDPSIDRSEINSLFSEFYYDLIWDYILVDEAQDCNPLEQELFYLLVGNSNVIVAYGTNQIIRGTLLDWSKKNTRKSEHLKHQLRQKNNIILFTNEFLSSLGYASKLNENKHFLGGKIIIASTLETSKISDIYDDLISSQGIDYDILMLVPPKFTLENTDEQATFPFKVWDGTVDKNDTRELANAARLIQYDSCRGLEGWTCFAYSLDSFFEYKWNSFIDVNSNSFTSIDERRSNYVNNWMMISLTRSIDTLVITYDNKDSKIAKILKKISNQFPDFVEWYE